MVLSKRNYLVLFAVMAVLASCGRRDRECVFDPDVNDKVEIPWLSLSDSLVSIASKSDLVHLLTRHPVLRDYFFNRTAYPNDSVFINELYKRFTNPYLDTLRMDVKRVFGDEQKLREQFNEAFGNLRYYYPQVEIPRIVTVVSGLETDLFVTDSVIYIGLDYYLGPGARFRPNVYQYMLRLYSPETVVPAVMLLKGISDEFNFTNPEDKTVLADMIAYGKAYYFAKHMLPCVPDSVLIGYTAEEMEGSRENAHLIWFRLVEDQVLYATSHLVKQKYLDPRPRTIEVGEKCPGRIGQWVGWEIVKSYMERHPQTTLPELMQMKDADVLFKQSGYRPVK
ncbi:MAG: gliding motility lipoprotein GldB [Cyclobacteriaceae bacterium]|nr:gliding motility lipoprotein GldB [Cyclobacteriaceae bacterium]